MSTTVAAVELMTAEQLFNMPDDNLRHELVKGELTTMCPAGGEDGAIIFNVTVVLGQHLKATNLGQGFGAETGFITEKDPDTVRAPDVAFVRRERIPETGITKKFWSGAPDLAVEVLSPGDTVYEVEEKVAEWLAAGASAVWVLNPKRRSVAVHDRTNKVIVLSVDDELDGSDVVPGFRCRVVDLFV